MNKISEALTEEIEKKLSKEEKEILTKFYKELSISAGLKKINQYKAFVLKFKDTIRKPLTDKTITRDDLIQYWNLLKNSEYSWNSQCMQRKYIKRFIRFLFGIAKSNELLDGLKAGEFKPSEKYTKESNITPEELEKMLRSALSLRDKAMLSLLYESASRPEELLKLKWKDLKISNADEGEVLLFSSKTNSKRTIPIKESIIHLRRWKQEWQFPDRKEDDYIFPSMKRENKLTTGSLNNTIKKIAVRAGIKKDNFTAYTFRHSRLTDIYNKGVQGFDHNLFAGHKKGSRQTATYVKTDEEEMKTAMLEKVFHIEEISENKEGMKEFILKMAEIIVKMPQIKEPDKKKILTAIDVFNQ